VALYGFFLMFLAEIYFEFLSNALSVLYLNDQSGLVKTPANLGSLLPHAGIKDLSESQYDVVCDLLTLINADDVFGSRFQENLS